MKAITFAIVFSLASLGSLPAHAVSACASDPSSISCITKNPKSFQVVVNKISPISPKNYYPAGLVKVPKFNPFQRIVRKEVSAAIVKLGNQMKADGKGTLIVQSGFRSFASQTSIHSAKVRAIGKVKAEKLAARPGYSEHQTGLAVDFAASGVSTLQISFAKTKAGIWLAANAYRYGFIMRYPSGKTAVTGYSFEPWHFRFVGVKLATAMRDQNISTLEEFYQLPAAPKYLN